jgi:malonyl-CoA decarboxylase
VSLGDLLIKRVVDELSAELPNLSIFSTLSPIPGFRSWLEARLDDDDLLSETEDAAVGRAALRTLVERPATPAKADAEPFSALLLRLAARYLTVERRGQRALDPVANFHLSNGSRVEHINWWANPGASGWDRGLTMMVNYRYVPDDIESNHDGYVNSGIIPMSSMVEKLTEN